MQSLERCASSVSVRGRAATMLQRETSISKRPAQIMISETNDRCMEGTFPFLSPSCSKERDPWAGVRAPFVM